MKFFWVISVLSSIAGGGVVISGVMNAESAVQQAVAAND